MIVRQVTCVLKPALTCTRERQNQLRLSPNSADLKARDARKIAALPVVKVTPYNWALLLPYKVSYHSNGSDSTFKMEELVKLLAARI